MNAEPFVSLIKIIRKHGLGVAILLYLGYMGLNGKIEFSYPRETSPENSHLHGSR